MKWNDFIRERDLYFHLWLEMKNDYSGSIKSFLDKSRLVIFFYPRQTSIKSDVFTVAKENSQFFVMDKWGKEYVVLAKAYKRADKEGDSGQREAFQKKVSGFEISKLSVVNHRYEIRFPTINIDLIQEIKESKYVDNLLTDMSKVSIRVVLKKMEMICGS